jgi:hypothetical protein
LSLLNWIKRIFRNVFELLVIFLAIDLVVQLWRSGSWGRTMEGAVVGLVFGVIFGANRVVAAHKSEWRLLGFEPKGLVGWDIKVFTHSPFFWSITFISALTLGYVAGHIGYHHP